MKKNIFILVLLLFTATHFLSAQDTAGVAISVNKFERKIKKRNAVVMDVRTPEEYKSGFIPKALNYNVLDSVNFVQSVQLLDKNKKYFIYCKSGRRSGKALMMMKQMGFSDLHHLSGGITAWDEKNKKPS